MSKLKKLGLDLPVLPTTSVGSLPKPESLKKARTLFSKGKMSKKELEQQEKEATKYWIKEQEKIGIDVIVDGEQYRGDMVEYFALKMNGFAKGGLVRSYGNRYYHKPVINGKIKWPGPITVEDWKFAQSLTKKPVKGMLTGAYTMMDWSFIESYKNRAEATMAMALEIRKEVEALIKAGAKIIQVDEPALSVRTNEVKLALESLKATTDGLPAYFITHCCYGEFDKIYDELVNLPVDNLDIEMSNSNLDLLKLMKERPLKCDISFGVIDVHSHKIEDKETVKKRIGKGIDAIGKEKFWIDPDCGLKTRTEQEAIDKLRVIVDAVKEIRKTSATANVAK